MQQIRRRPRTRLVAAATLAFTLSLGLIVGVPAGAAPRNDPAARFWESLPAPTVPQQPGYRITGYNVGKGNYRGAIDAQTGSLWLTNVSPLQGAVESSILEVDPVTMRLKKRIRITQQANTHGHGSIAAQYEIGIPTSGNTVWTTAAAVGEVNVWDKTTGRLLKRFTGVPSAHGVSFAEKTGVAVVSMAKPGGIALFDMKTLTPLGKAVMPGTAKQMGTGIALTDDTTSGATVTVPSYYSSLTQFRITRSGPAVRTRVVWSTRQPGSDGHGSIIADPTRNRVYVNHLYLGLVQVYDLRTGTHLRDVVTGPGTNSLLAFHGKVYAANYFAGYISVIDPNTFVVTRLLTTGLLPNQVLAYRPDTFLVIDKSSLVLDGGYRQNRGVDRIWKVRALR